MDEEITIEAATSDDLNQVVRCWLDLIDGQREYGTHMTVSGNETSGRDVLGRYIASDNLLVARANPVGGVNPARVVGFAMYQLERGLFEQDVTRGMVENLYVVPDQRNRGIGSALLDRAERLLRRRGASIVSLSVMADNRDARRFYRRQEYAPHRITFEREL